MGLIFLIGIVVIVVLAFSIGGKAKKVILINLLIIVIYNVIGWSYILKFLDTGGASLGPGLVLLFVTAIHVTILLIVTIIRFLIGRKNNYS